MPDPFWSQPDNVQQWDWDYSEQCANNHHLNIRLRRGERIQYEASGNSLYPRVREGDCCILSSVPDFQVSCNHDPSYWKGAIGGKKVCTGRRSKMVISVEWRDRTAGSADGQQQQQ